MAMAVLIYLIDIAYNLAFFIIIAQVAISWLIAFDILNTRNEQARNLVALLHKATEPVYKPIRRFIPAIGGIDLTPLIVMIGLSVARNVLIGFLLSF